MNPLGRQPMYMLWGSEPTPLVWEDWLRMFWTLPCALSGGGLERVSDHEWEDVKVDFSHHPATASCVILGKSLSLLGLNFFIWNWTKSWVPKRWRSYWFKHRLKCRFATNTFQIKLDSLSWFSDQELLVVWARRGYQDMLAMRCYMCVFFKVSNKTLSLCL